MNLDILNPEWPRKVKLEYKEKSKVIKMLDFIKQYRPGLIQQKVQVHRKGKVFERLQWVRPNQEDVETASKWGQSKLNYHNEVMAMEKALDQISKRKRDIDRVAGPRDNHSMSEVKKNVNKYLGLYEDSLDAYAYNRLSRIATNLIDSSWHITGNFNANDVQDLVVDSIDRILYQELRSWERQLGEHGIRHIYGNIDFTSTVFDELEAAGLRVSSRDRLLTLVTMINHDIGYSTAYVRRGIPETQKHKELSLAYFDKEIRKYQKFFSEDELERIRNYILVHDSPFIDWDKEPVLTAIALADNLSLYQRDKLPELFRRVEGGIGLLIEMQKALVNKDETHFKELRDKLFDEVTRTNLPTYTKNRLKRAAIEVSPSTPKVTVPMLIGNLEKIEYKKDEGLSVTVKWNENLQRLHDIFDMGQEKLYEFAKDYGIDASGKDKIELPGLTIFIKR